MFVNIVHYFPSSINFLWETPQIFYPLGIDCSYLFRLINHNHGIKASICIRHIFLAAVRNRKLVIGQFVTLYKDESGGLTVQNKHGRSERKS
jgi:hypothetical protein